MKMTFILFLSGIQRAAAESKDLENWNESSKVNFKLLFL